MKNKRLEYDKFIKNILVMVDIQEKVNYWILNYFKKNGINYQIQHLNAGDYAFALNGQPQSIVIERKNSLNELSGNLATKEKKDRFYIEFDKLKTCEKILLIENDSIDNLISGTYGTDYNVNSYIANLILLLKRKNIQLFFINRYNMGFWILKLFYYHYYEVYKSLN
jgi:ERCC4-type nuclease